MNAPNLAICVAPVIVKSSGPASLVGTMESMGRAQGLLRDLIMQCDWIFENEDENAKEVVEEEAEEEGVSGGGAPEDLTEIQAVASI